MYCLYLKQFKLGIIRVAKNRTGDWSIVAERFDTNEVVVVFFWWSLHAMWHF